MNIQELNIINYLSEHTYINQRETAEACACSLGMVNRCMRSLQNAGYLTENQKLTPIALQLIRANSPRRAVILAAGAGMRMVPVNMEHPKAMLEVKGEVLIERLIRQLQEAGVCEIFIVVGFMKEAFEYLIDAFGVELVVNQEYAAFNNLHSLAMVREKLSNAYILPCDVWCQENPFRRTETYSWYMVKDNKNQESEIRVNRKQQLIRACRGELGNPMVGISYIAGQDGKILQKNIEALCQNYLYDHAFWEEALYQEEKMLPLARVVSENQVIEINTYRQLQALQERDSKRKTEVNAFVCQVLSSSAEHIHWNSILKNGMTNRSFLLDCKDQSYVLRVSNESSDPFVDRMAEYRVYQALKGKKLSDDVIAMDPKIGCKLSRFFENARPCNPADKRDVKKCMVTLQRIHNSQLVASREVDLFERLEFYESLWQGKHSAYRDYETTKKNVFSLKPFIQTHREKYTLTHLDAVPDNFLFYTDPDGDEKIRLIDWECAAMQDPLVDVALFCISALYRKDQTDEAIDLYFENSCPPETRVKIYCYMAICGLMWSNWCEYQLQKGAEFGQYSLKQYRYAKEFYRYAVQDIEALQFEKK